jgi:hypothetical protein
MNVEMYVLTDKYSRPRITIAIAEAEKGIFSRGIALCSKKDWIDTDLGIIKAKGRLQKAIKNKSKSLPINSDKAIRILFEANSFPFKYKADYDVQLTEYEKVLLGV